MNIKTERVLIGFLHLSDSEKKDFIREINEFYKKAYKEQSDLEEHYKSRRVILGPLSSDTCPCCGR